MIDLHCHLLPGLDDGPSDRETALKMAELAAGDGISHTVCTPHIYPGLFDNTHDDIRLGCDAFRDLLQNAGIELQLSYGADIQVVPELVIGLQNRTLPTIGASRYFLFEPPHHVPLPQLLELVQQSLAAGFVPIITHPERLAYIESDYKTFVIAAQLGAWLQLTAGSLLGRFGSHTKRIADRFLADGIVHVLATDAHNLRNRSPELNAGKQAAEAIVGAEEALRLVHGRPALVLADKPLDRAELPPGLQSETFRPSGKEKKRSGIFKRLFR